MLEPRDAQGRKAYQAACQAASGRANLLPVKTKPVVLYEDDYVIAFDKPAGLLSVPDRWDKSRENLMRMVHEMFSPGYFNIHRLDRETSGVMVCAKDKSTLDRFAVMVEKGLLDKVYGALTRGVPRNARGRLVWRLAPDPRRPGCMQVSSGGKPAITEYEVAESFRRYAFLQVRPLTGRTHQIRVHLARSGCPVVGDAFYGDGRGIYLSELKPNYRFKRNEEERPLIGRLALHAHRVTFEHPRSGQAVTIESPWPHEFEVALKYLRRFGGAARAASASGERGET